MSKSNFDDPNFGMNPEEVPSDWELGQGPSEQERISKIGKSNLQFLEKINVKSTNNQWQGVKQLGKEAMELVSGDVVEEEERKNQRVKILGGGGRRRCPV